MSSREAQIRGYFGKCVLTPGRKHCWGRTTRDARRLAILLCREIVSTEEEPGLLGRPGLVPGIFCKEISPYVTSQEPATERHTGLWAEANPVHAPASLPLPTGLTSSNRAGWRPCELSIMQADRHARDLPGGPQSVQPHNRLTLRNGMGWR